MEHRGGSKSAVNYVCLRLRAYDSTLRLRPGALSSIEGAKDYREWFIYVHIYAIGFSTFDTNYTGYFHTILITQKVIFCIFDKDEIWDRKSMQKSFIITFFFIHVVGKGSKPNYSKIKVTPSLSDFRLAYFTSVSTLYNLLISRKSAIVHFLSLWNHIISKLQLNN